MKEQNIDRARAVELSDAGLQQLLDQIPFVPSMAVVVGKDREDGNPVLVNLGVGGWNRNGKPTDQHPPRLIVGGEGRRILRLMALSAKYNRREEEVIPVGIIANEGEWDNYGERFPIEKITTINPGEVKRSNRRNWNGRRGPLVLIPNLDELYQKAYEQGQERGVRSLQKTILRMSEAGFAVWAVISGKSCMQINLSGNERFLEEVWGGIEERFYSKSALELIGKRDEWSDTIKQGEFLYPDNGWHVMSCG